MVFAGLLVLAFLTGCADGKAVKGARDETASDSHVDFDKLKNANSDIFAWVYVPDTNIDCPVLQSST